MITTDQYIDLVKETTSIDFRDTGNEAQLETIFFDEKKILQVVAGPGSGKTTVLVLRALKFVFVDGILPENILITTFTRKAAKELRTRWLDWGTLFCANIQSKYSNHGLDFSNIDLNRCRIDTLDSIAQQALTDFRIPGTVAPSVIESSSANLLFKRYAFQEIYWKRGNKALLDSFLSRYTLDGNAPRNQGEALKKSKDLIERLIHDRVDLDAYSAASQSHQMIVDLLMKYYQKSIEDKIYDFSILEDQFLKRLQEGSLDEWLNSIEAILIDEYQDSNPLQEEIYFSIIRKKGPQAMLVGDDDQSMYRFRGGSVELFTEFETRCKQETGNDTYRVNMVRNFRSSPEIIDFYNSFIENDPQFKPARIAPPKPKVVANKESKHIRVIGMFRETPEELAKDLAAFCSDLKIKRRFRINESDEITLSPEGDLGDFVFLAHTVEEKGYFMQENEYFPYLFRNEMSSLGLKVFNARGQALRAISDVNILLGLVLLAIDPEGDLISEMPITNQAQHFLHQWKSAAERFIETNPSPKDDAKNLKKFIQDWQSASKGSFIKSFPRDWPVLELIFKLISWMPGFQTDSEHQVWLEAIMRIISSAGLVSAYGMQLFQNYFTQSGKKVIQVRKRTDGTSVNDVVESRKSLIRDALIPIAEDEVEVDEDIIPSIPRDQLQLMTIHQAKGLEFPLVIVDVGSRFKMNHAGHRFRRFPTKISNVAAAEDDVEPFIQGTLRGKRNAWDRTFDDLVRLYYVAYSRPQSVLMLVGCEQCLSYGKGKDLKSKIIPNIALGWCRDETWPWRQGYSGKRPPIRIEPPFELL